VFVSDLDRDLAAVTLRQEVPPKLSRSGRGLKAVELKGLFIRGDLDSSRTSKENRGIDLPCKNKDKFSFPT
jgi:hypothetical protein